MKLHDAMHVARDRADRDRRDMVVYQASREAANERFHVSAMATLAEHWQEWIIAVVHPATGEEAGTPTGRADLS